MEKRGNSVAWESRDRPPANDANRRECQNQKEEMLARRERLSLVGAFLVLIAFVSIRVIRGQRFVAV
jgi:hypothetical protein